MPDRLLTARSIIRDEYEADEYDLYVLRRADNLIPLERKRMALLTRGESWSHHVTGATRGGRRAELP